MTKETAAKKAKKAAKTTINPFPIIGYTIWWSIPQTEISKPDLEKLVKNSIGEKFMREVPGKKRALRTALQSIETSGLIRRIRDDEKVIAYTLHQEMIDKEAIDLNLKKEQVIVYDKEHDRLNVRMTYKKEEIERMFERYQTVFTEADVRSITLNCIKANGGVTMRENGGIYFIPQVEVKEQLKAFIEGIKGAFYALGVPDEDTDKTIMHKLIKEELDRDLQLAAEDLKQLMAKESDRTKVNSFESKIESFKILRSKTELYKDLLTNDVEDLTKTINDLNEEVSKALMGEIKEYSQAKEFPYKSRVRYNGKSKDKIGMTGIVIGYRNEKDNPNKQNIRVLFDKNQSIQSIRKSQLQLIK